MYISTHTHTPAALLSQDCFDLLPQVHLVDTISDQIISIFSSHSLQ